MSRYWWYVLRKWTEIGLLFFFQVDGSYIVSGGRSLLTSVFVGLITLYLRRPVFALPRGECRHLKIVSLQRGCLDLLSSQQVYLVP